MPAPSRPWPAARPLLTSFLRACWTRCSEAAEMPGRSPERCRRVPAVLTLRAMRRRAGRSPSLMSRKTAPRFRRRERSRVPPAPRLKTAAESGTAHRYPSPGGPGEPGGSSGTGGGPSPAGDRGSGGQDGTFEAGQGVRIVDHVTGQLGDGPLHIGRVNTALPAPSQAAEVPRLSGPLASGAGGFSEHGVGRENVPLVYRDAVRNYFRSLEPGEEP